MPDDEWWKQSSIRVPLPERAIDAPMGVCWGTPVDADDLPFPAVPSCWICVQRRHVEPVWGSETEYFCRACEVAWVPGGTETS